MGIINLTPDSFYDGGKLTLKKKFFYKLKNAKRVLHFLDLGGYSSRPGAQFVSEKDEIIGYFLY